MISPKFLFLFSISLHLAIAQPPFLYQFCDYFNYGNYTLNSTYHRNLNRALSSITPQHLNSNGFYNLSANTSSDRVNVIGLCRGDVKPADCYSCLNDSRQQLLHQCPNRKEAVGWYDNCMLRYTNRSIFGLTETDPSLVMFNMNNVTSDAARFDDAVVKLLTYLTGRAASGGSLRKFATGNVSDPELGAVYGLVQCTPDLSPKACNSCLAETIEVYPQYFAGKIGGRIMAPSCNYRYEINMFYNLTSADAQFTLPLEPTAAPAPAPVELPLPPPTAPAPAPIPTLPPASTNSTATQGEKNKTSKTFIGTTYVVALMAVVSMLLF